MQERCARVLSVPQLCTILGLFLLLREHSAQNLSLLFTFRIQRDVNHMYFTQRVSSSKQAGGRGATTLFGTQQEEEQQHCSGHSRKNTTVQDSRKNTTVQDSRKNNNTVRDTDLQHCSGHRPSTLFGTLLPHTVRDTASTHCSGHNDDTLFGTQR